MGSGLILEHCTWRSTPRFPEEEGRKVNDDVVLGLPFDELSCNTREGKK